MLKLDCTRPALLLFAILPALLLNGCGFKDRPLPPQQVVPRKITDLSYQLTDRGVILSWSYPVETVTGRDLHEISSFSIYRAVIPAEDYCDSCPVNFGRPINIPGGALPNDGKKTATYETSLLRPGSYYFFKVRSSAGWWAESADSNVVSFLWNIPPMAPQNLQAVAGDSAITLRWQPVTTHRDGSTVSEKILYQVQRSTGGGAFSNLGQPVQMTSFQDSTAQPGHTYFYRVQAISSYGQGSVGGGISEAVSVTARDLVPPAPPTGVRAIRTAKTVKIFWEPVGDADLKGYRIYRRLGNESTPRLIGEVQAPYVVFTDTRPPADTRQLFYSVSAIDGEEPPNESERSAEVMIRR